MVVRVIKLIGWVLFGILALSILLVALGANEDNAIVALILGIGRFLAAPFRSIFDLEKGSETLQIAINWGIAAVVYLLIAFVIAALLAGLVGGRSKRRRTRDD